MKRIMVIGVSAGVGKSTFARKLSEKLDIEVCHLDTLFWKSGWVEATLEEFTEAQQEIIKKEQWIIEGNYSTTFEIRTEYADTIIYLELPRYVCLYRVIKRWLTHIGKKRPDVGCTEKMDWAFIKFIWTTYHPRVKKMKDRFHRLSHEKTIIVLKGKEEINAYLKNTLLNK
ncbi:topology modulation protein [Fredinandcohnia quinoae]|uniref:Topology modulation protein n=1 Tax=Fredinandcohnia quinoae TaxID=2918902 RepID=A0AAW5EA06_9BACI|nr:topology modulation protein [Fredinandcohnia sp. SECRCQ15]MCH1626871.1 topology modulation protein [Fredinandcohnia sp. SECRCQ15]